MKNANISHLILSGGGFKGMCFIGVLRYFLIEEMLDDIKYIAGASIGSLFGLIFALKIPLEFLEKEFIESLNEFIKEDSLIKHNDIYNLLNNLGFKNLVLLTRPITRFLKIKYGSEDITFIELTKRTGVIFYVSCTNFNTMCNKIFSLETTPDINVIDTIRASMSIPFVYQPIKINGEFFVDGILTKSFNPKNIFTDVSSNNVLYLQLCTGDSELPKPIPPNELDINLLQYGFRMIQILIASVIQSNAENEFENCTNTVKFDKSPYDSAIKFLTEDNHLKIDVSLEDFDNLIVYGFIVISEYMFKRYGKQTIEEKNP